MKKSPLLSVLAIFLFLHPLIAQVGIGTTTPNASAALDITSTTRGLLVPRITTAQRDAIVSPATGLLIYQTDGTTGFYYRNGAIWTLLNFTYILQQNLNTNGKYMSGDGGSNGLLLRANGILLGKGALGSGADLTEVGAGTKMIWYPKKAAFRAGGITSTQWDNTNIGNYSAAFGYNNTAKGTNSFSAGYQNTSSNLNAVTMGYQNTASGITSAAIGYRNKATGVHAIAMGDSAIASGNFSVAIGHKAIARGEHSVVLGFADIVDSELDSTPATASAWGATALGGATTASGAWSTAMGLGCTASGSMALANGWASSASGYYSTSLGFLNQAGGDAAVCLGSQNSADGPGSVAIGNTNEASGESSMALGSYVSTNTHFGSVIIGDGNGNGKGGFTLNNADNQMLMRFAGGYKLFTNSAATVGVRVVPGGNAWSTLSDKHLKENLSPVNGEHFLQRIASFNLTSWNYKGQDPKEYRHYGPMAQDFYQAFGKDTYGTIGNDTTINQADFDGINLIAIQALEKRTRALAKNSEQLQKENEQLKEKIKTQEQNIAALQNAFAAQQKEIAKRLLQLEAMVAAKPSTKKETSTAK